MEAERVKVNTRELRRFVVRVLIASGLNEKDAKISTSAILCGDRRGIESHGVARLKRYVDGIKSGIINLDAEIKILNETPVTLLIDGDGGMGHVVGHFAMKRCIEKAKENFLCMAAVRNSNHYGIAGFYSLMAMNKGYIGFSMTNSAPLMVPTFGKNALLGTNPISVSVPSGEERPFLLDMATSTVPRGKLEVYARADQEIPNSWATDENGNDTNDPKRVLQNLAERNGGGLLPLGGAGMEHGGHKGYGLAVLVEILCGVLSGGAVGKDVYGKKGQPPEVSHFFCAVNPAGFAGLDAVKERMDYLANMLRDSEKAEAEDRIYIAGETEMENTEKTRDSLTLQKKVFHTLNEIGKEHNLELKEMKND